MAQYFVEFGWDNPLPDGPDEINNKTVDRYVEGLLGWYEKEKDEYKYNLEEATVKLAEFKEELKRVKAVNREAEDKEMGQKKLFPREDEEYYLSMKACDKRIDDEVGLELVIERLITEVIPRYKKKLRQINNHVLVLKMKQEQMIDRKIGPQEAMDSVERC